MSGYADLLSLALTEDLYQELDARSLLEILAATSARRAGSEGTRAVDETLALDLAHDGALIALCRQLGVCTGPVEYQSPEQARARLTAALKELRPEWSDALDP